MFNMEHYCCIKFYRNHLRKEIVGVRGENESFMFLRVQAFNGGLVPGKGGCSQG